MTNYNEIVDTVLAAPADARVFVLKGIFSDSERNFNLLLLDCMLERLQVWPYRDSVTSLVSNEIHSERLNEIVDFLLDSSREARFYALKGILVEYSTNSFLVLLAHNLISRLAFQKFNLDKNVECL
jgi:hypothetical protein